jgi:hypothetical protein
MGSMPKRDENDGASGPPHELASREAPAPGVRDRQAAASYLQASTLADDPGEGRGCLAC